MQRHSDALFIQHGACNPSGIARTLVRAIDEIRTSNTDTATICSDPAVRLITHQLCHILGIITVDAKESEGFNWDRAYFECIQKADAATIERLNLTRHHTFLSKTMEKPVRQLADTSSLTIPEKPA